MAGYGENDTLVTPSGGYGENDTLVDEPAKPKGDGDFVRGVKNYLPQMKEMAGAIQTIGGVGAKRIGLEGAGDSMVKGGIDRMSQAKSQQVSKPTDEFTGAWDKGIGSVVTDWLPYQAGQAVGNLGEAALAGLAGAAVGGATGFGVGALPGAVGGVVAKGVAKKAAIEAAQKIAADPGKRIGANAAIAGMAGYHGAGEVGGRMLDEMQQNGTPVEQFDMGDFVPAAAGHAALEFVGDKIALGAFGKGAAPRPGVGGFVKDVAERGVATGLKEAPTEVGQTGMERWAADLSLTDAEARKEYLNAAAAGAGMGVVTGGAGGAYNSLTGRQQPGQEQQSADTTQPGQDMADMGYIPSEGGYTPEQVAAFNAERQANKATMANDYAINQGMNEVNPDTNEVRNPIDAARSAIGADSPDAGAMVKAAGIALDNGASHPSQVIGDAGLTPEEQFLKGQAASKIAMERDYANNQARMKVDAEINSVMDRTEKLTNLSERARAIGMEDFATKLDKLAESAPPKNEDLRFTEAVITHREQKFADSQPGKYGLPKVAPKGRTGSITLRQPDAQQPAIEQAPVREMQQPLEDKNNEQKGMLDNIGAGLAAVEQGSTEAPAQAAGDVPVAGSFKKGDTVRFGNDPKVDTVESVGPDGWVYTLSGAAGPGNIVSHAVASEVKGSWGDTVSDKPTPSFQENVERWKKEGFSGNVETNPAQPAPLTTDTSAPSPVIESPAAQPGVAAPIMLSSGKPFKSKEAATFALTKGKHKELASTHRVTKVKGGGFSITPKPERTAKQYANDAKMAAKGKARKSVNTDLDSISVAIRKHGGINRSADLAGEIRALNFGANFTGHVWRNDGHGIGIDNMARELHIDGYLQSEDVDELFEKLSAEYGTGNNDGKPQFSSHRGDASMESAYQAHLEAQQEARDAAQAGIEALSEEDQQAVAAHADILAIEEDDLDSIPFTDAEYEAYGNSNPDEFFGEMDNVRENEGISGENVAGSAQGRGEVHDDTNQAQAGGAEGFALEGQTAAGIAQREQSDAATRHGEVAELVAKERADAKAAEERRQKDNATNGNAADAFSMTSTEPVDKRKQNAIDKAKAKTELAGQTDLLSQQSAIESIKQSEDIPTADKIRLAAELRNGGVTAEDVAAIVGEHQPDQSTANAVRSGTPRYIAPAFTNAVTSGQGGNPAAVEQPNGASTIGTIAQNGGVQQSRRDTPATGITEQSLRATFTRKFPQLTKALDAMIKRGNDGKKGGAVLIQPGEDMAQVFAAKTGMSMEDAKAALQISIANLKLRDYLSSNVLSTVTGKEFGEDFSKEPVVMHSLRDAAKHWAKDNIIGSYHNEKSGIVLEVRKSGIDNAIQHGGAADKIRAFAAIPDILKHGIVVYDGINPKNKQGRLVVVSGKVLIEGKQFYITAGFREDANGRLFYDHELIEVERADRLSSQWGAALSGEHPLPTAHLNDYTAKFIGQEEIKLSQDGKIQAFYSPPHGLTFLVAENLDADTAANVLLHESVHGNQRDNVDAAGVRLLTKQRKISGGKLREVLDEVANRMVAAGAAKWDGKDLSITDTKEAAPYIVEVVAGRAREAGFSVVDGKFMDWVDSQSPTLGKFIRDFVATIRAGMLRLGAPIKNVSVDDLVAYAKASMKRAAKGDVRTDGGKAVSGSDAKPDRFYSPLQRAIEQAPAKVFTTGKQSAFWLQANKGKLGLKDDELQWSGVLDYLQLRGKVTKAEVLDYLSGNGVVVSDVVKAQNTSYDRVTARELFDNEWPSAFEDWLYEGNRSAIADAWENENHDIWSGLDKNKSTYLEENTDEDGDVDEDSARGDYEDDAEKLDASFFYTNDEFDYLSAEAFEGAKEQYEQNADRINNDRAYETEDDTKFSGYWSSSYPGGIDGTYREILVTLPFAQNIPTFEQWNESRNFRGDQQGTKEQYENDVGFYAKRGTYGDKAQTFTSQHWDEPNVLVHVRLDEVIGADGKRYVRVGEVQSDWGQKGKKDGFKGNPLTDEEKKELDTMRKTYRTERSDEQNRRFDELESRAQRQDNKASSAPFVTDTRAWAALGIKRAIAHAVEVGADGVVFGTGQQNADLYDLSKQINSVKATRTMQGHYAIAANNKRGKRIIDEVYKADRLDGIVGKELATKIISQGEGTNEYSGLDLKVGGEGMRAFYDQIVPSVANDVLKKIGGGKVEAIEAEGKATGFHITSAMRNKALQEGLPLFSKKPAGPRFSRSGGSANQSAPTSGNNASFDAPEPSKIDRLIYTLQDKNIDLKRVSEAIKATGKDIADSVNAYLQEELYHGRTATRTKDFVRNEIDPLINEMRMRGVAMADFEEYLWMRHAEERNAQIAKVNPDMDDGGSGIATQDAIDYLKSLPANNRKAYESLAKKVDAINKATRQTWVQYGVESQNTVDAMESAYQHYVPLMREDMEQSFGNGTGQGFSVKGNSSKRATGSNRAVVDILANMAQAREKAIIRGEKNRVSKALIGLAALNPNAEFWKIDTPPTIRTVNDRTGLVEDRIDPSYKNRDNVIMARIPDSSGKIVEHSVIFNERDERAMRMAGSLKNLDQDQIGEVLSAASGITRYFASINTQYNPIFGMINLTRDVQGAMLNLSSTPLAGKQKAVLGHTLSALRGIYADIRDHRKGKTPSSQWSQLWEEFQKEGGQTGYRDMFKNAKDRAEALEQGLNPDWWQTTKWGKVLTVGGALNLPEKVLADKAIKPMFEWLTDYNETMENSVRLAAYKVAKENGMSNQQAASLAKNLTVNFNRKGEIGRQVGSLYAFFNASVQGTARLAETLKGPAGKKIVMGGILLGAMQAMMLAMAGMDDDEPPEFIRDRAIIIPTGDGKYISIPMPLGFNVLPNFGRIATEFVLSGFKEPQKRIVHLLDVVADSFNPIGNAGISMQTIAPTVLDPMAALAENKDWTGKPIARKDFNALNPSPGFTRAKDTASVFSKALAEGMNWITGGTDYKPGAFSPSPDQIDYLIGQVLGGVGREYLKFEQTGTSLFSGEELPTHKIPLIGRFYGDTTGQSSQGSAFYSNLKEINGHEAEIKGRRANHEDVAGYIRDNPESRLVMLANHTEREVSKLRKQKRMIMENDASPERIKMIEQRITETMKRLNDRVLAMKEAA